MTNEGTTLYCGDNCNHTGPHVYPPTTTIKRHAHGSTEAGRRLRTECANEWPRIGAPGPGPLGAAILAIEAEARAMHEEALRDRGWKDEYEAETDSAMDFGMGHAEGRADADIAAKQYEAGLRAEYQRGLAEARATVPDVDVLARALAECAEAYHKSNHYFGGTGFRDCTSEACRATRAILEARHE